jgi:ABC-type multidrug transport system ATPase subunit
MMNFTAPYSLLPYNLTSKEGLTVISLFYGVRDYKEKVKFLIDEFDLDGLVNKKIGQLYSGEQICLRVAQAFVNNPKLLYLMNLLPLLILRLPESSGKKS